MIDCVNIRLLSYYLIFGGIFMFGKKFLQSSSGIVLSASCVSMAQNAGVFADEETKLALENSVEESVDFLEAKKKGDSVVGDTFNNANCVGEAKEEEPQVTKFEDLGTSPVSENNENSDSLGEKSAIGGDTADSVDPTVEQDNKQVNLPENSNILQVENGVENNEKVLDKEQLLKKKLKELEERQGENSQKIEELKKMYEEEMKKLNLEGKNLVTEVNKIKDELGMWRLRTWDDLKDTSLVVKIYFLFCFLDILARIWIFAIAFSTGSRCGQIEDKFVELILGFLKSCVNAGKFVVNKFSDGFRSVKDFYAARFGTQSGYERISSGEN